LLKLENFNLKCRLATKGRSTNKKYSKTISDRCEVVTLFLHTFRILGPLPILGTDEDRDFKDVHKSVQIEYRSPIVG